MTSRRIHNRRTGSALLEMAILLPVLVLLAIGVAEYGRIYITAVRVANAATAAAEFGSQSSANTDSLLLRQVARDDAGDATLRVSSTRTCRCPGSDASVTCTDSCAGYGTAQFYVEVTASKTHAFLLRYPGLPDTISIRRTSTFRVQ